MKHKKRYFVVTVLLVQLFSVLLMACGVVEKIEVQTNMMEEKKDNPQVADTYFEKSDIRTIRENVRESMSILGTDEGKFQNIGKTDIIPIITDKDEIFSLRLKKLEGNEITKTDNFYDIEATKKIMNSDKIYRNDMKKIKKPICISGETDIQAIMEFAENIMNNTYKDSPFQWVTEYVEINSSTDKMDFVSISIRPAYEGVVFTRTLVLNRGVPTNVAPDFRSGLLNITRMNQIDEYYGISPYYEVEKTGEGIEEILSIESVLSIVANKIDKNSVSQIKLFELAYRLNKNMSAVPIWNIVVNEQGADRNFQIDAVTGDVYFE